MNDGFGHEKPGEGFTNDWYTPPKLLKMLGEFDLDPCAGPISSVWDTKIKDGKKSTEIYAFRNHNDAQEFLMHASGVEYVGEKHIYAIYDRPWPTAKKMIALPDDGLAVEWEGRVWCNPPYGPHVDAWAQRLAKHGNGMLLIFNRSETDAWQRIFAVGDGYLLPHGRTCFYLPDGTRAKSGTAPSALIAFGEANVECLRTCGLAGAFFRKAEVTKGVKISTL